MSTHPLPKASVGEHNFRQIYSLYKELHANIVCDGPQSDAARVESWHHLTKIIGDPQSLSAKQPYDEATLLARCCSHISTRRQPADVAEFRRLNDALGASLNRTQHCSILTFLLQLAENESPSAAFDQPSRTLANSADDVQSGNFRLARCATTPSLRLAAGLSDGHRRRLAAERRSAATDPLVQDVIYVLGGISGQYLRKDIISGEYKLDPKTGGSLAAYQANMMLNVAELGYYHDRLVDFLNPAGGKTCLGLMGQGLCTMMQQDVTNYYGFVAMLQDVLNRNRNGADATSDAEDDGDQPQPLTLLKLYMLCVQPLHRSMWLAQIVESCHTQKGGELASTIAMYRTNGDPDVRRLVDEMLVAVCGPLQQMLAGWLLEGEINDPHGEFFVETLPSVGADRLWSDKYRLRRAQLPAFIDEELAHKMLVTGKSVNFLREICKDRTPVAGREELLQCLGDQMGGRYLFAEVADTRLHALIERVYLNTSKRVLDIVMGPHKLMQHLKAMRNYLLLGQGDFIGNLIQMLKSELDRPAHELHQYELATILETAIRTTTAQYDDPEVVGQLEVRLLSDFKEDLGWDTFQLRYSVTGPLSTMLEQSMSKYQKLFKPLWSMKHLDYVLSAKVWKEQVINAKALREMRTELAATSKRLNLVTHQMVHFIHQMLYYILFEVIECQWTVMMQAVQRAQTLDDIFEAHDRFLRQVRRDAFLESDDDIYLHMASVFSAIGKLEGWQDAFYALCFGELQARRKLRDEVKQSERRGEFGVTKKREAERDAERKAFDFEMAQMHTELDKIGVNYEVFVRKFLLLLAKSADANIQLFGTRLDFNEYYKKRDTQLDKPLTFANLRQSLMYTSKSNASLMSRSMAAGFASQ